MYTVVELQREVVEAGAVGPLQDLPAATVVYFCTAAYRITSS